MKEQEQRVALAKWAGWNTTPEVLGGVFVYYKQDEARAHTTLPDTNSLDVLHEMEKRLTEVQRPAYYGYLWKLTQDAQKAFECSSFNLIHAGPEQRRKAILQTLNLWREDSNEVGK